MEIKITVDGVEFAPVAPAPEAPVEQAAPAAEPEVQVAPEVTQDSSSAN